MGRDDAEELVEMRREREAHVQDMRFVRQRYEATDMLVSLRRNEAGFIISQPYQGEPFDPKRARVVKGGWDHDHCYICEARVVPGDEWWAAAPPDQVGLCLDCYAQLSITERDSQSEGRSSLREKRRQLAREREMPLTEAEWLSSKIPRAMLMALEERAKAREIDRKLRLFACACVRRVWHLLDDPRCRMAVEVAERYAEGLAGREELDTASDTSSDAAGDIYQSGGLHAADVARINDPQRNRSDAGVVFGEKAEERAWHAAKAAHRLTARKVGNQRTKEVFEGGAWVAALSASRFASDAMAGVAELRAREAAFEASIVSGRFYQDPWQSDLLRCLFGNPFRPVDFDPTWRSPASVALAQAIYQDRSFDLMPTLADVLEGAGCDASAVLDHCRSSPGEHARGCWVVDALLGKT
jgi:hypothetical protein